MRAELRALRALIVAPAMSAAPGGACRRRRGALGASATGDIRWRAAPASGPWAIYSSRALLPGERASALATALVGRSCLGGQGFREVPAALRRA